MDQEARHEAEHRHEERVMKTVSGRNDYFLGASILIAGVMIAVAVIYAVGSRAVPGQNQGQGNAAGATSTEAQAPQVSVSDAVLGNSNAPVTIFEYADYQCPFCGRFHTQTSPLIRENYVKTGKVKMIYRDFAFLGAESVAAAEAARCAQDQAKFWEYHDALYDTEIKDGQENNGNLNRALFVKLAGNLGLNGAQFSSCLDSKKYEAQVSQERNDASNFGVGSTPSIFVNGNLIKGAQPFSVFQAAIDAELAKNR